MWGYLKIKVYTNIVDDIDNLKEEIRQELLNIGPEVINKIQNEFLSKRTTV